MSEHQELKMVSNHINPYQYSDERCKVEQSITQVQPHNRFGQCFASVIALFTVLAIASVGEMVAFAGLLLGYSKKLKRFQNTHQLVARRQESPLDKEDITTMPVSYRGSDDHKSFQRAAEVSDDHGSLDSPSWLSNRLCG